MPPFFVWSLGRPPVHRTEQAGQVHSRIAGLRSAQAPFPHGFANFDHTMMCSHKTTPCQETKNSHSIIFPASNLRSKPFSKKLSYSSSATNYHHPLSKVQFKKQIRKLRATPDPSSAGLIHGTISHPVTRSSAFNFRVITIQVLRRLSIKGI